MLPSLQHLRLQVLRSSIPLMPPCQGANGHLVPLNRESPTVSTVFFLLLFIFFLWYTQCAAGTVSPPRPCSWVSIAVNASYLIMVVKLEDVDRSRVLLLCVTRAQSASSLWCLLQENGSETSYLSPSQLL